VLFFAGFQIDARRAELRGPDGEPIKLRPKTYKMLLFFAANAGRVISKQELMETFWPDVVVGEDTLFQGIREIRAALGDDSRQMVRNISGRGYLFEAVVTQGDAAPAEAASTDAAGAAADGTKQDTVAEIPVLVVAAPRRRPRLGQAAAIAVGLAVVAVLALAGVPAFEAGRMAAPSPVITVMPIVASGDDAAAPAFAAGITEQLTTGLAQIESIRVVTPPATMAHASLAVSSPRATADYAVSGELQNSAQGWTLRARMTRLASGEIVWVSSVEVSTDAADPSVQQSRLAAGIGHPLALRINAILTDAPPSAANGTSGSAKVTVQQATASINQTTPERFRAAQAMLETALVENPDDIDLQAALAALQLRGIQMVWYSPQEREAAKIRGTAMLERVLRTRPGYIPVLESYCRFLSATNRFVESLVACARTLSFDPWDGIAIYHIGLGQMFLGRFEDALASFKQADRFDTPTVSRWTWLLGAGLCEVYLDRNADAVAWLQRSLAVTPGTGRTHLTLVAAYQRLGRLAEARATLAQALELRPGATADNIQPPLENTSPVYREAAARVKESLVEAGLPRQ
jgi:DNA-binding winged helix-turn-helix (wHTH) protein/TolB-like protein/tetratricopeptide (TPR) repeat protein